MDYWIDFFQDAIRYKVLALQLCMRGAWGDRVHEDMHEDLVEEITSTV